MSARNVAAPGRRWLLLALIASMPVLSLAARAHAQQPRPPLDDAGYFALADAMQSRLDGFWNPGARAYRVGGGGTDPSVNAQLLLLHAVAAQRGHEGPSRNDRRARIIARRLTASTPFVERPGSGSHAHAPGWSSSLEYAGGEQHLVFDAQVVDGLVAAWRARRELALDAETVALISDRIHRTVDGRYWRWPAMRLNQVNWYALMYAASATVAGDRNLLRRDLRHQLVRFVRGIGPRAGAAGNLGPGGRFHYLPQERVSHPLNIDSAEYANIVMGVTRHLNQARAAGMRMPASVRSTLRSWATRVLAGYWTHAGYLNWDTGLGFDRWHQAKKLGLAQEALIGLAQDRTLGLPASTRSLAKHVLDRGLLLYERLAQREGGIPAPLFFGVNRVPQSEPSARLAAARIAANAAKAIDAGLGRMRSAAPPALFAYDPDVGRVAVTTRHYNTAIVPVNQRAFPYGGIELARLFDRDQDVAATIGGTAPAGFGLVVRDRSGARVFATQVGRAVAGAQAAVRLTRGPNLGAVASARRPGRVYAGAFRTLKVTGTAASGAIAARTTHEFTARTITTTWTARRTGARALSADILFPTHGAGSRTVAVLRDGRRVRLGARRISLRRIRVFEVRSRDSGYTVRLLDAPRGATVGALRVRPQSSAPQPGPSLSIRIATGAAWRTARAVARITVQPQLATRVSA